MRPSTFSLPPRCTLLYLILLSPPCFLPPNAPSTGVFALLFPAPDLPFLTTPYQNTSFTAQFKCCLLQGAFPLSSRGRLTVLSVLRLLTPHTSPFCGSGLMFHSGGPTVQHYTVLMLEWFFEFVLLWLCSGLKVAPYPPKVCMSLFLEPMNVTVVGKTVIADVIK